MTALILAAAMTVRIAPYGGAPTVFIDGQPETGLMHFNLKMTTNDVAVFRDAGVHLYSFHGYPAIPGPAGSDSGYELSKSITARTELNEAKIDELMTAIVSTDPQAKVLVRMRTAAPNWWIASHSNELVKVWDVASGQWQVRPWASPASKAWHDLIDPAMRRIIRHCEAKWGDHILGYHPGIACCTECAYDWFDTIADFSEPSLAAYGRLAPDPERFVSRSFTDVDRLFDPVADADCISFLRHQSQQMADAVLHMARVVKGELAALRREKLCGVFYGYLCFPPNRAEFLGSGHYDFKRVLESPDIDFIAAPLDYSSRAAGNAAFAQTVPASIALHGKLYYGEEDSRFHLCPRHKDCVSGDRWTTSNILWRNMLNAFTQRGTIWWMDLYGEGWYRDPWFSEELAKCRAFAEKHLAKRKSVAEIAVFLSEREIDYERAAPVPLANEVHSPALYEVASVGAPFDIYLLEDLPLLAEKGKLAQYRMAVVPNACAIDGMLREAILRHLCADNRTVVWQGKTGYIDGMTNGAACVQALTGIGTIEMNGSGAAMAEAFPDGRRLVYGAPRRTYPQLMLADDAAEARAWFTQGQKFNHPKMNGKGVAFAVKQMNGWRSASSVLAPLPSELLRRLAVEAGVHIYSPHGDQVFAGEGWFAVAAKMPGKHTLTAKDGKRIEADMKRGEVRIFE